MVIARSLLIVRLLYCTGSVVPMRRVVNAKINWASTPVNATGFRLAGLAVPPFLRTAA